LLRRSTYRATDKHSRHLGQPPALFAASDHSSAVISLISTCCLVLSQIEVCRLGFQRLLQFRAVPVFGIEVFDDE
jgi:hypothetical protein